MQRFSSDAGIAIGPILFVIALLAILAAVIGSGTGDYATASVADRVYSDIQSQANLIRTKIGECNIKYGTNNNGDGYPPSDQAAGTPVCALDCEGDPDTTTTGTDCAGNPMTMQNLWYGIRPALLPPPVQNFTQWYYMNAAAGGGGRCIWTQPVGNPISEGVAAGLVHAATRFSTQELTYNPAGSLHRFVIWITLPSVTADPHCLSN